MDHHFIIARDNLLRYALQCHRVTANTILLDLIGLLYLRHTFMQGHLHHMLFFRRFLGYLFDRFCRPNRIIGLELLSWIIHKSVWSSPIYQHNQISWLDLPNHRISLNQTAASAVHIIFSFEDNAFQKPKAKSAPTVIVSKVKIIGEVWSVQVLLKPIMPSIFALSGMPLILCHFAGCFW